MYLRAIGVSSAANMPFDFIEHSKACDASLSLKATLVLVIVEGFHVELYLCYCTRKAMANYCSPGG